MVGRGEERTEGGGPKLYWGDASGTARLPVEQEAQRASVLSVARGLQSRSPSSRMLENVLDVRVPRDDEDARGLVRSQRVDLVLIELGASAQGGLERSDELLGEARVQQVPVIFVTEPVDDLPAQCLERGAADCIVQPVSSRELLARVRRAINESQDRRKLQALARTDALTGLPNYRALAERSEAELHRAIRYGHPVSVVTVDLDHLKHINDRYGHEMGNRAIIHLARHLAENLRESDFAARFGGDEFVILLPHQLPEEAAAFAERTMRALPPLSLGASGQVLTLGVSMGIAGHGPESPRRSVSELLEASDAALNEAKRRGRGQVVVHGSPPLQGPEPA